MYSLKGHRFHCPALVQSISGEEKADALAKNAANNPCDPPCSSNSFNVGSHIVPDASSSSRAGVSLILIVCRDAQPTALILPNRAYLLASGHHQRRSRPQTAPRRAVARTLFLTSAVLPNVFRTRLPRTQKYLCLFGGSDLGSVMMCSDKAGSKESDALMVGRLFEFWGHFLVSNVSLCNYSVSRHLSITTTIPRGGK